MSRLFDAVRDLGLEVETSPQRRWVRFKGVRGPVYVLETQWGGDFYTWCDTPERGPVEVYRDPVAAIEAGLLRSAVKRDQPRTARDTAARRASTPAHARRHHAKDAAPSKTAHTCDACGAYTRTAVADATGFMVTWLCAQCRQRLSVPEVERLERELAMRGVPHS